MENEIIKKTNLIEKILNLVKRKRKQIFLTMSAGIVILFTIIFYGFYQDKINKEISEKYVEAGIFLSNKDKEKSKIIYKEIIFSKNKFYSVLALNNILENNLEEDSQEILKLFKTLEKINISKEQKNLVKLKKALYLKKISKNVEGNKLLKEIIADNSIWKNTAIELAK